jgi:hypothetical protein
MLKRIKNTILGGISMIIKQRRIRDLKKLHFIKPDSKIIIGLVNIEEHHDKLLEIGFPSVAVRFSVLPNPLGAVSRRNADGDYILHRDMEKETHYRTVEWTWKQWAGGGDVEEKSDFCSVPYKRYPRTFIPPQSIELTITNSNQGEMMVISPPLTFDEDSNQIILHTINLFLELFGECYIFSDNLNEIKIPKVERLNWEVLPKGKRPWSKLFTEVEPFIKRAKGSNQKVVAHRLEKINDYQPDFIAIGNAGFRGYLVYGFEDKKLYILESIYTNNATYVLNKDWKELSRLSKAEILNNSLHKDRIIHSKEWDTKVDSLLA